MSRCFLLALALVTISGCPSSDPGPPVGGDTGHRDGGVQDGGGGGDDTGPPRDTGPTMRDAAVHCGAGQHACGGGCITDQANDPANGCRLGCGTACPTPTMGEASCTAAGTCDFSCPPPFHRTGETCTCMATTCDAMGYMCGSPDDGCGMPLNCGMCASGATCLNGICGCMPDSHENNDSNAVATHGAALSDSPDSNVTLNDYTIDSATDVDWIQFHVTDAVDGGDPHVTVRLYNIPSGTDLDLGVYYVCDNNNDGSTCATGTQDNMLGHGCTSVHPGIAEENVDLPTDCGFLANADGTLYVRVSAATFNNSCMPYAVDVRVR